MTGKGSRAAGAVAVVEGVCEPNPGAGGWGCVLPGRGPAGELSGGRARTTLFRMELEAALAALRALGDEAAETGVLILTKSRYLSGGLGGWLASWDRNGLLDHVTKFSPKNADLWRALRDAAGAVPVRCEWVPAERRGGTFDRARELALAAAPPTRQKRPKRKPSRKGAEADAAAAGRPALAEGIHVFTDGSCLANPGPGGWGAVIIGDGQERRVSGGEPDTTNNRMELRAAIEALQAVDGSAPVTIHTDSKYVQLGVTEWAPKWMARGLLRGGLGGADPGHPKNRDLWLSLLELTRGREISWEWVRGHSGDAHNESAHRLAHAAATREAKAT